MRQPWIISLMDKIAPEGLRRLESGEQFRLAQDAANPDAIIVRSRELAASIFANPRLLSIARAGSGVDNIPVEVATQRGIPVFNAPGANANAVKEAVIGAMIALSRNLVPASMALHGNGTTDRSRFVGAEVAGRTLGIIGLGQVGQRVAVAGLAMGMRVIGYDKYLSVPMALRLPPEMTVADEIETVLREADILTLHALLTNETRGMVNAQTIAKMKPGVRVINFARGEMVIAEDMRAAIDSGRVAGYATDFPEDAYRGCDRVLMTPHLGASTVEAQVNCAEMAAEATAEYLLHGSIRNSVNFPTLQLQRAHGAFRMAFANENVPGMISKVSATLAERGVNIASMANQSNDLLAYTILDCSPMPNAGVLAAIRGIRGIRMVRLLDAAD